MNTENVAPISSRVIPVMKDDHEGALMINAITGVVQQEHDERPEWADGLGAALLTERHGYYTKRLGEKYADEHRQPEAFNFDDLGWVGMDPENGDLIELSASEDYRMQVISGVLGIDREEGTMGDTIHEVELSLNRERTEGEVGALETAQNEGFEAVKKDGTNG